MADLAFVNSVVPRDELEAETAKYALACANNQPTDTVFMQKVFFEIMKQHQGEHMGSLMSAWLESMRGPLKPDAEREVVGLDRETMERGHNKAVKGNDANFPPEWRLSKSGREQPE